MNEKSIFQKNLTKTFFSIAIPSIIGMLIVSTQIMVDGLFISNYIGAEGLAAVNLSMPYINLVMGIAMMVSIGGSVITAKFKGNGNRRRTLESFSFSFYTFVLSSIFVLGVSLIFKKSIIEFLGTTKELLPLVTSYLTVMIIFSLLFNLPIFIETYSRVAEKPYLTFVSGLSSFTINILLDYILLGKYGFGVEGAALATCIANGLGGLIIFVNIVGQNKPFKLTKVKFDYSLLKTILFNGSSEMFSILSISVTTYLFNIVIIEKLGQLGVSAFTIIVYINSIISITLFGLSQALQPILSYNLGAGSIKNLYRALRIALLSGGFIGILSFLLMNIWGSSLVEFFVKDNDSLRSITNSALYYFIFEYLFSFVNIIISTFHTAIERPISSAAISLGRSLIFIALYISILPSYLGITGIWITTPLAEFSTLFLSGYFFYRSYKFLSYSPNTKKEAA